MAVRIRTLLLTAFFLVAAFTPVFTYVIHDAITDAEQQSSESLSRSQDAVSTVENVILLSENIVDGFRDVQNLTEQGEYDRAEDRMQSLRETISQFEQETDLLIFVLNQTDSDFSREITQLQAAQTTITDLRDSTWEQVRDRSTVSVAVIERSEDELNDLPHAAAGATSSVLSVETSNLKELTGDLRNLSEMSLMLGLVTIIISSFLALVLAYRISKPITILSEEAEKIKAEDFDAVDIGRLDTRITEFRELKQMIEDVVLALKAEFERDHEAMNDLALAVTDILAEEMPRGVAESSLQSACETEGIDPLDLDEEELPALIDRLRILTTGLDVDTSVFERIENHPVKDDTETDREP